MYFYPKHISQEAVEALKSVDLHFQGNELYIPDEEFISNESETEYMLKGVRLVKRPDDL